MTKAMFMAVYLAVLAPSNAFQIPSPYSCQTGQNQSFAWCDTSMSIPRRAAALVAALDINEKINTVTKQVVSERYSIPDYGMFGIESLHGVRLWPEKCPFSDRCTTIFPAASASGRSFNRQLWLDIGHAMAVEGRVLFNLGISDSITMRGPQLNMQRDPRWGRNSNSPSEDPFHIGMYGRGIVRGMQGSNPDKRITAAEMKHYTGYGVENNRFGFRGYISVYDMVDTYMKPLRLLLPYNVSSYMCSYNAINDIPSCAHNWLHQQVTRDVYGFTGVIEADQGAVENIQSHFHFTKTDQETVQSAYNGTVDRDILDVYQKHLNETFQAKMITEQQITESTYRLLEHRFRMGLFDPYHGQEYTQGMYVDPETVHNPKFQELALQAALESHVLVKNDNNLLPLDITTLGKVAVIGPSANVTDVFLGDYRPAACPGPFAPAPNSTQCLATVLDEFRQRINPDDLFYAPGCLDGPPCTSLDLSSAVQAAQQADVIVLVLGEKATDNCNYGNTNSEGTDRQTACLPGSQTELVKTMLNVSKPVIAIIISGGSVSSDELATATNTATIYAGYAGEGAQEALMKIIFGEYNPSARLPFTVYPNNWEQSVDMNNMSMQAGLGRTYRYLTMDPVYRFGYGLSYTSYKFAELSTAAPTANDTAVCQDKEAGSSPLTRVCGHISNDGQRNGTVVVLMYVQPTKLQNAPRLLPKMQLTDFARLDVATGESVEVCTTICDTDVSFVDPKDGSRSVLAGDYNIIFDNGQEEDATANTAITVASSKQRVVQTVPPMPGHNIPY
eukprot:TRINITY_DN7606_c0_g1_i3.p1 TRINITY_DN7606_c0_g1~~TRINITY_DN7606_c0_g1_i3.p1  ORF type:complete len:786 (+),score=190.70 TRINITY_DN7606_c0_g1_i3:3-2360(+)